MTEAIARRFFAGDYTGLVRTYVDQSLNKPIGDREQAYLIGALVFVGRLSDAKAEFRRQAKNWSEEARVAARFFLAIGACRNSQYQEAKTFLRQNYRALPGLTDAESRFFIFQGYGFFRYFCSRFTKSALWAERAWRIAFGARFSYGMILSADLRGHALCRLDHISEGLQMLERALKLAHERGNVGAATALEISHFCYLSQFGLLENASHKLRQLWQTTTPGDTYSRSNLLVELARALILEGEVSEALNWIDRGVKEVFSHGHRRQKAALLARRAHALHLQRHNSEALQAITQGLAWLEPETDLFHRLELVGLKSSILHHPVEMQDEIEALTRFTGTGVARRIVRRRSLAEADFSDDRLGSLLDRLAVTPFQLTLLLQAEEQGWKGVLNRVVEREDGLCLYLDLLPRRLVLFDRGDVHVSAAEVPPILRRLLLVLAQGLVDKQKLVEMVWGYKYSRLRHDPMLYNAIYRLRQLLGPYESHLIAEEGGYRWDMPVTARVFERPQPQMGAPTEPETDQLSLRQHQALELASKVKALSVSDYSRAFGVAKPTATRDLAELVNKGYLAKTGKARATRYTLPQRSS